MTITDYLARLVENSREKYIIITEILRITKTQNESFTEEAMDNLDRLINDKQTLIDRMLKLDEDFEVYFTRLKSTVGINLLSELNENLIKKSTETSSEAIHLARQLKSIITDIADMIKNIAALEEDNSIKANALLNFLASEVKKLNKSKHATNAYSPGGGYIKPPSYFIDSKK